MTSSALLSFTIENVRSCRDEVQISMVASSVAREDVVQYLGWSSGDRSIGVLPTAGVFGANASGKSTILKAMGDMRAFVLGSFHPTARSNLVGHKPFKLDSASLAKPSRFEIDLVLQGVRWQYGFELDGGAVLGEYAFYYPNGRQSVVFERDGDHVRFGKAFRAEGRLLESLAPSWALFVSVAGALRDSRLAPLFKWFQSNLLIAESSNRTLRSLRTVDLAHSEEARERVLGMLCAADLGITDISREQVPDELRSQLERAFTAITEENDGSDEVELFVEDRLRLTHCGEDGCGEFEPQEESLGTLVWVGLVGAIIDALDRGDVLLADELDASLHPHLVGQVIALFQSPLTNPNCAQLIFNAHDVTVLGDSDEGLLGRDQVWFTEKDNGGATTLYPLTEFAPRKDHALERRYLQGRFGALPVLDSGGFKRAALHAGS